MDPNRLNSPSTCTITLEVMGHELHFAQDPNSKHLGTTVWDASMVFAKYLEKNCRKGRFSASKLKGKRVIELGAGCGVAGFAMAILGCHVISTDQREVLPLLKRNVEWNTSRIVQTNHSSESFGSLQVAELDWGNEDHIMAVQPPFDYVIGTDVVYAEQLLEPLRRTIIALSGPKTTIMLGYEIRSTSVHEKMLQIWKDNFEVKTIPRSKMDGKYQDPSIHLYIMGQKSSSESSQDTDLACSHEEVDTNETEKEKVESVGSYCLPNEGEEAVVRLKEDSILARLREGKLSDWERRRYGTIAAQLLRDVKIDVKVKK